jgi:hypothetical protein
MRRKLARLPARLLIPPLAVLAVFSSAPAAHADDLRNSLTAGGSATITLIGTGTGSTTVRYWVVPDNVGGSNGCDATGKSPAHVTVLSPSGVSATPATFKLAGCGSATAATNQDVVFTSGTPGDYTVAASVTDDNGQYTTTNATFTLHVVRANTPPSVAVTGVVNGANYEKGQVPAANCNASDAEDGSTSFVATLGAVTGPNSAQYGLGSQTASCSYTDHGGLTATATATYSIVDSTVPVLHLPGDIVQEATSGSGAAVTWKATATDAVDPAPVVTCSSASGATFRLGSTAVTCVARDAVGNSSTGVFNVIVQDTTKPLLILPPEPTVEATGPGGATVTYPVGATDTVDGTLTPSCVPPSGSTFTVGTTSVNCTVQDTSNNLTAGGFGVNVVDTTPPTLHLPVFATLEATGPHGAVFTYPATATDLVSGNLPVSCDSPSGVEFAIGSTIVSCSAADAKANTAYGSFTVTVRDTTAPTLTLPEGIVLEATKPEGADTAYVVSASDTVDGTVPVTCTPANGTFAIGTTTVHCGASDAHGNTTAGSFPVTVADTTPPEFTSGAAAGVTEATGPDGAVVTFTPPTASDTVDGKPPVTCDHASGATYPIGTTTVICTVADAHGNHAETSFGITVIDSTPPDVTVPDNKTVEASGPNGAVVSWSGVSAHDAVAGNPPVSCDHASGDGYPLGVTTVTCTATDNAGNTGTGAFTISVQDTSAPDVTVPDSKTVEATGPNGAAVSWSGVSAHDAVDGDRPVTCDPVSGSTFAIDSTTVVCTAEDRSHHIGQSAFVVTVVDTKAPVVSVADRTVEATGPNGAAVSFTATAMDTVDGAVTPSCTPTSGNTFAIGETAVTCTATDAHGNTGSASFTVTVADHTAPAVSMPSAMTVEATGPEGARVDYAASANDTVDGPVAPTCTPAPGGTFPLGPTTVTCTATDAHGNAGTATFTVTVRDTKPPVLNLPKDITVFATSASGAPVAYPATATDTVAGVFAASCAPPSGSVFGPGTRTVQCSATDPAGNTAATGSFTVTVRFEFNGFLAPVDNNGVLNVIKGGSTVPIKWQLPNQSGGFIGDLAVVTRTTAGEVACGSGLSDDLTAVATGGTSLRYDSTANQYIYNWQSPKAPGKCYQVTIGFAGGQSYSVKFQLK